MAVKAQELSKNAETTRKALVTAVHKGNEARKEMIKDAFGTDTSEEEDEGKEKDA